MSRAPWNKLLADGSQVPEWWLSNSGQVAQPVPDYSIYAVVQQMWSSAFILIAMEACIIMVTFGAGLLEGLLQIAQESLGICSRS